MCFTGGSKPTPSRPPPPNVAAKTVSEAIQSTVSSTNAVSSGNASRTNAVSAKSISCDDNSSSIHHEDSTDTEDSDDSDNEV